MMEVLTLSISTPSTGAAAASSKTSMATAAAPTTRSTGLDERCIPGPTCSPRDSSNASTPCFDRPGTQQRTDRGHQRPPGTPPRSALEFRNLTNYIASPLLETGGFRPRLHPEL